MVGGNALVGQEGALTGGRIGAYFEDGRTLIELVEHGDVQHIRAGALIGDGLGPQELATQSWDLVEGRLIVELKAVKSIVNEHIAQLLGYLKSARIETGLLINFGAERLYVKKYGSSPESVGRFRGFGVVGDQVF